jgi:protein-arginine kinase activator protein McsA
MITFHVPSDQRLLAAFGEVALRHEHMNYALRMTIKSLTAVTPSEALAATMYESSAQLRDRVRKIARRRLGDGAALVRLQAMLAECRRLTEKRNDLVHGLWAQELDGEAHVRDGLGDIRPLPTAEELQNLASELERHTARLNIERLESFLVEALQNSRGLSGGA